MPENQSQPDSMPELNPQQLRERQALAQVLLPPQMENLDRLRSQLEQLGQAVAADGAAAEQHPAQPTTGDRLPPLRELPQRPELPELPALREQGLPQRLPPPPQQRGVRSDPSQYSYSRGVPGNSQSGLNPLPPDRSPSRGGPGR